jgi:hypothetical protein
VGVTAVSQPPGKRNEKTNAMRKEKVLGRRKPPPANSHSTNCAECGGRVGVSPAFQAMPVGTPYSRCLRESLPYKIPGMVFTRVKVHFSTTVGEGPEVEVGLVQSLRAGIHSKPQK